MSGVERVFLARCEDPVSHQQTAVSGFHAQDPMVATCPGTAGCKRQREARSSWRDFKATSGNGCVGSRNAGKGKAFVHSVAVEFPQFFKLQEERIKFEVYPFSERAECDDGEACGNDDPGYLRPSPGTKNVPWRPKADQAAKEQAALLTTACAGPSRMLHSAPSNDPSPCDERGGQHGCVHRW